MHIIFVWRRRMQSGLRRSGTVWRLKPSGVVWRKLGPLALG
jgi:hypothetical protein